RALSQGEKYEAAYELPFLAHATMEPSNCTLQLKPDSCEIWLGTQVISRVQGTVATLTGLPVEKVTVHNHLIGGGFGRRLEPDMALSAVRVAQHLDGEPVKVVWTREEDIQHDVYRPAYRDTIAATLSGGKVAAFKYKVTGSSVIARWLPPAFQHGIDIDAIDCAVDMPYDIAHLHVEYVRAVQPAFGSFIATVVEAEVDAQGEVRLRRVTSAVDTGIAVNPDTIVAQLQGGLIFGLTAALYGEVTVKNGRVQQSNFNDYRMLRI